MSNKKSDTYTAQYTHYAHPEEFVDPNTGETKIRMTEETVTRTVEVIPDFVDIKVPKKFKFNNGNFITIFQKAMANIAMFGNLSKGEMKMLLYLIGTCGQQNSVCIDLVKLAEDLKTSKGGAATCLKGLVERNIVIRKDGYRYGKTPLPFELHLNFDQINYGFAYNGTIKHYREDKQKHPQLMQADGETPLMLDDKKQQKSIEEIEQSFMGDKREEEPSSQYEDTVLEQAIKQKDQEDSEHVG